ncbi:beta-1,3-glucanosyltransferase [Peziza echinospora]|nr:beta-1,3-glucanosyltransferase [Peziza echinospora]
MLRLGTLLFLPLVFLGGALAAKDALHAVVIKISYLELQGSFIKGVAYQPDVSNQNSSLHKTYHDPLADNAACARDVPLLEELGTNVIRVYAINPNLDHQYCMRLLNDAGIYVISDLSEPGTSINRDKPAWNLQLYNRYTSVIDALAPYPNVIGFFAGNEVSNQANNTNASPFVKAAIRDMKAYIVHKGYRTIPVGYATNDDADIRYQLADYFNCGNRAERADFWGYNIYSWCGQSSYSKSGYQDRTKEFSEYSIPVFFAEYGCNEVRPREFTEVEALYGPSMSPVFSGGIVYMYHEEENQYGLVQIKEDSTTKRLDDFFYLKDQISKVKPKGIAMSAYNPQHTAPRQCPTKGENWDASDILPPTPNKDLCQCMFKSLECVASTSVKESAMGDLYDYVCGPSGGVNCSIIAADGSTGEYGMYSMCNATEKLSYVFNRYFMIKKKQKDACSFDGNARLITNPKEPSQHCVALFAEYNANRSKDDDTSVEDVASLFAQLDSVLWLLSTLLIAGSIAGAAIVFV